MYIYDSVYSKHVYMQYIFIYSKYTCIYTEILYLQNKKLWIFFFLIFAYVYFKQKMKDKFINLQGSWECEQDLEKSKICKKSIKSKKRKKTVKI